MNTTPINLYTAPQELPKIEDSNISQADETLAIDPHHHLSTMQNQKPLQMKKAASLHCDFNNCHKSISTVQKIYSTCACQKVFCGTHKPALTHHCSFDYLSQNKARLEKELNGHIDKKRKILGEFRQSPSSNHSY